MGAPSIDIAYYEKAVTAIQRGSRGILAMLLIDNGVADKTVKTIIDVTDIPTGISDANKKQIKYALIGYQTAPKKIIAYFISEATTTTGEGQDVVTVDNIDNALEALTQYKWNYLVCPDAETLGKTSDIAAWIKSQRTNNKKTFKAVLSNEAADCDGVINVTTGYTDGDGNALTAERSCARAGGIICGTPLTIACTYAPLPEATACDALTQSELDEAVDAGKFVFMWDGEKVKVCRGVNSFTTTTADKGEQFKKIKLVETMDLMMDDIRKTAQDSYIGKYSNGYDNKCLLITAINGYFSTLAREGVIASGTCSIDIDATSDYIKSKGGVFTPEGETEEINIEDATEEQIKRARTGSYVFLKASVSLLDAIEDIKFKIYI